MRQQRMQRGIGEGTWGSTTTLEGSAEEYDNEEFNNENEGVG